MKNINFFDVDFRNQKIGKIGPFEYRTSNPFIHKLTPGLNNGVNNSSYRQRDLYLKRFPYKF